MALSVGNVELGSALNAFERRVGDGWFGIVLDTIVGFEKSQTVGLVEESGIGGNDEFIGDAFGAGEFGLLEIVEVELGAGERPVDGVAIGDSVVSLDQMEPVIASVADDLGFVSEAVGDISR